MSSAARSLFVFGIYAVCAGAGLLLTPGIVLNLLGFPPVADGWVRVVGTLAIFLGTYHIIASRNELAPYISASVWVRIAFSVVIAGLVVSRQMPAPTLIFAAADLLGAIWTWVALRSPRASAAAV